MLSFQVHDQLHGVVSVVARRSHLVDHVLDEEEAQLLEASIGMPALLMTYLNFAAGGQPYEYRKMIVRGDRSKYYVDVDFPELLL